MIKLVSNENLAISHLRFSMSEAELPTENLGTWSEDVHHRYAKKQFQANYCTDILNLTILETMMLCTILFLLAILTKLKTNSQRKLNTCEFEVGKISEINQILQDHNRVLLDLNKQKEQLSARLIEKEEISQSAIRYAHTLQLTVLTHEKMVKDFYERSFIWLQPCQLLTGDFFFSLKKEGYHLVAICDCTGHGVAAAFLTLLCKKALTLAIRKHKAEDTHLILESCRKILLKDLGKDGTHIRDGMDMALCCLSLDNGKVFFSGANRQILIWNKGELSELAGDRMPIGYYEQMGEFKRHEFQMEQGSRIYMFSDGIYSQLGGDDEKCWKRANFRNVIRELQTAPISMHKQLLEKSFLNWKGQTEQTDDILVVGIEFFVNTEITSYYCPN